MRSNLISISISIHALREEGDSLSEAITKLKADFYPRPPRGGRQIYPLDLTSYYQFLSTPSARRATLGLFGVCAADNNFYPRPPRGGRLDLGDPDLGRAQISIHALREEGDGEDVGVYPIVVLFLSTPSARRATSVIRCAQSNVVDFYPRPPRGGRR